MGLLSGLTFGGSDIASFGSSIVNGIFGSRAQKKANETNIKIAQMNNDAALQQMRENNQWNWDKSVEMFNMENEYNSPEQQMSRFRAAGLNPYVAMSEGLGAASSTPADGSTPQAQAVPAMQQATVEPVPSVTNGVLDSLLKIAEIRSKEASAAKTKREREYIDATFDDMVNQVKDEALRTKYAKLKEKLEQENAPFRLFKEFELLQGQINKVNNEASLIAVQEQIEQYRKKFEDKRSLKYDEIIDAEVDLLKEGVNLKRAEIATESAKQSDLYQSVETNKSLQHLYQVNANDSEASMLKKIDDSITLYLDATGHPAIDDKKRQELQRILLKDALISMRTHKADLYNPLTHIGKVLGGSVGLTKVLK